MDYGWKLVKIQGVSTSINLSRLESVGRSVMRNLMFLYSISAGSGRRAFMMVMWWVFCTFSRGEQMDTALKQGEETNIFVKIVSEILKKKYQTRDYTRLLESFLAHSTALQSLQIYKVLQLVPNPRSAPLGCVTHFSSSTGQSTTLLKFFSSQGAKLQPYLTNMTMVLVV